MADKIDQLTLPNSSGTSVSYDIDLPVDNDTRVNTCYTLTGLSTVAGSSSSSSYKSVRWYTSNIGNDITAPYDGMKVMIKVPLAGVSTAGVILSINGDNDADYHPVAYNVNTALTTHYPVNTYKIFVYDANQKMTCYKSSGTAVTVTGVWKGESNYDSNTTITYGTLAYYLRPYAGTQAIYRYKFVMFDKDNRLVPLTTTNVSSGSSVTTNQTPTNVAFRPEKIYWYNTTGTVNAGAVIGGNTLMAIGYNANSSTNGGMARCNFNADVPAYRMIYLCGTYDKTTGLFTLRGAGTAGSTQYYVFVPTNAANLNLDTYFDSGYDYILLGGTYSSADYIHLMDGNPLYHFDGTNLIPYDTWNAAQHTGTITGVSVNGTPVATSGVANITSVPWSIISNHSDVVELKTFSDANAGKGILLSGGNSGYSSGGTYLRHTSTSSSYNTVKLPATSGELALTTDFSVTTGDTKSVTANGNTLTFGSNAFNSTTIPTSYLSSSSYDSTNRKLTITPNSGTATTVTFGSNAFNSTTIPTSYLSSSSYDSTNRKLTITPNSGTATTVTFGSNAFTSTSIPTTYLKSASASGNTLTLTKQDNSTVEYTPSFTESDTLSSVTARGATTSTAVTFSGGATVSDNLLIQAASNSTPAINLSKKESGANSNTYLYPKGGTAAGNYYLDLPAKGTSSAHATLAVTADIPTETTVAGWGFTKNTGTVTSVDSVSPSSGNVALSAVRYTSQSLTDTQKEQARTNIEALNKIPLEWNKSLANGSNGKVCLGKFFMYDSNVTIEMSLTTSTTYKATLVIATQNMNRATSAGSITANVYDDAENAITPLLSIFRPNPNTANGSVEVYANLPGWSKCLVHVRAIGLESKTETGHETASYAYDILTNVSSIPTTITGKTAVTPTNKLRATYYLASNPNGYTSLTIGTTATTAAAGNHTHTASISQSGSSGTTLAHNTWYTLTAGGSTVTFRTPADNNTNYYAISSFNSTNGTKIATGYSSGTASTTYDLYAPNATSSQAGLVTTGAQTFSGTKTFIGSIALKESSQANPINISTTYGWDVADAALKIEDSEHYIKFAFDDGPYDYDGDNSLHVDLNGKQSIAILPNQNWTTGLGGYATELVLPANSGTLAITTDVYQGIATPWEEGGSWVAGDTVMYNNGNLYRCIQADPTGEYFPDSSPDHWQQISGTLALDTDVVHKTGNETIAGQKTFSDLRVLSSGSAPLIISDTKISRGQGIASFDLQLGASGKIYGAGSTYGLSLPSNMSQWAANRTIATTDDIAGKADNNLVVHKTGDSMTGQLNLLNSTYSASPYLSFTNSFGTGSLYKDSSALKFVHNGSGSNYTLTFPAKTGTLATTSEAITEISTQYIRIWDLEPGIYKLTYNGTKYLYYYGATSTAYIHTITSAAGAVILTVNMYSTTYKHWYYIVGTTSYATIYYGYTSSSIGSTSAKALNDLLTSHKTHYQHNIKVTVYWKSEVSSAINLYFTIVNSSSTSFTASSLCTYIYNNFTTSPYYSVPFSVSGPIVSGDEGSWIGYVTNISRNNTSSFELFYMDYNNPSQGDSYTVYSSSSSASSGQMYISNIYDKVISF